MIITGAMMAVEIVAGFLSGSMALLADGLHMASHAAALGITALAYVYARRHAADARFSFGTGKVNALGGFTGAVLLTVFALMMAWASLERLIAPVPIAYDQAILVAFVGLLVNGVSALVLRHGPDHGHGESHSHGLDRHDHDHSTAAAHDHNLEAAYLHVLADALTSILAIGALFAGKYFQWIWMDPLMGILGAILVSRWAAGLLRATSAVLLDYQGPGALRDAVRSHIEQQPDTEVADLHVWAIGPNIYAAVIAVVTENPRPPSHYKELIPTRLGVVHVTVEVHHRPINEKAAVSENRADGRESTQSLK